jgi:hypothetical protein
LNKVKLAGTTVADPAYDSATGLLTGVDYGNGTD